MILEVRPREESRPNISTIAGPDRHDELMNEHLKIVNRSTLTQRHASHPLHSEASKRAVAVNRLISRTIVSITNTCSSLARMQSGARTTMPLFNRCWKLSGSRFSSHEYFDRIFDFRLMSFYCYYAAAAAAVDRHTI